MILKVQTKGQRANCVAESYGYLPKGIYVYEIS